MSSSSSTTQLQSVLRGVTELSEEDSIGTALGRLNQLARYLSRQQVNYSRSRHVMNNADAMQTVLAMLDAQLLAARETSEEEDEDDELRTELEMCLVRVVTLLCRDEANAEMMMLVLHPGMGEDVALRVMQYNTRAQEHHLMAITGALTLLQRLAQPNRNTRRAVRALCDGRFMAWLVEECVSGGVGGGEGEVDFVFNTAPAPAADDEGSRAAVHVAVWRVVKSLVEDSESAQEVVQDFPQLVAALMTALEEDEEDTGGACLAVKVQVLECLVRDEQARRELCAGNPQLVALLAGIVSGEQEGGRRRRRLEDEVAAQTSALAALTALQSEWKDSVEGVMAALVHRVSLPAALPGPLAVQVAVLDLLVHVMASAAASTASSPRPPALLPTVLAKRMQDAAAVVSPTPAMAPLWAMFREHSVQLAYVLSSSRRCGEDQEQAAWDTIAHELEQGRRGGGGGGGGDIRLFSHLALLNLLPESMQANITRVELEQVFDFLERVTQQDDNDSGQVWTLQHPLSAMLALCRVTSGGGGGLKNQAVYWKVYGAKMLNAVMHALRLAIPARDDDTARTSIELLLEFAARVDKDNEITPWRAHLLRSRVKLAGYLETGMQQKQHSEHFPTALDFSRQLLHALS